MVGTIPPATRQGLLFALLFSALTVMVPARALLAADWPHWRGPSRNGVTTEAGWRTAWSASGPPRLWSANIGKSYAAVSVQGKRLYTIGAQEGKETLFCFDAGSGAVLWRYTRRTRSEKRRMTPIRRQAPALPWLAESGSTP